MLDRMKLSDASATYIHRVVVIYTSIAWVMVVVNVAFTLYSMFLTGHNRTINSMGHDSYDFSVYAIFNVLHWRSHGYFAGSVHNTC